MGLVGITFDLADHLFEQFIGRGEPKPIAFRQKMRRCATPPRRGGCASTQKYSQIRVSSSEAVTAANATRNAVIRSLIMMPRT